MRKSSIFGLFVLVSFMLAACQPSVPPVPKEVVPAPPPVKESSVVDPEMAYLGGFDGPLGGCPVSVEKYPNVLRVQRVSESGSYRVRTLDLVTKEVFEHAYGPSSFTFVRVFADVPPKGRKWAEYQRTESCYDEFHIHVRSVSEIQSI